MLFWLKIKPAHKLPIPFLINTMNIQNITALVKRAQSFNPNPDVSSVLAEIELELKTFNEIPLNNLNANISAMTGNRVFLWRVFWNDLNKELANNGFLPIVSPEMYISNANQGYTTFLFKHKDGVLEANYKISWKYNENTFRYTFKAIKY